MTRCVYNCHVGNETSHRLRYSTSKMKKPLLSSCTVFRRSAKEYNKIQVQHPGDDIQSFQSGAYRSYAKPKASSTLTPLELASTEALALWLLLLCRNTVLKTTCHYLILVHQILYVVPGEGGGRETWYDTVNTLEQDLMSHFPFQQALQQNVRRMDLMQPSRLWLS